MLMTIATLITSIDMTTIIVGMRRAMAILRIENDKVDSIAKDAHTNEADHDDDNHEKGVVISISIILLTLTIAFAVVVIVIE